MKVRCTRGSHWFWVEICIGKCICVGAAMVQSDKSHVFGPLHADVWLMAAETSDCRHNGRAPCFCILLFVPTCGAFFMHGKGNAD